jgi:hypothetical protein
MAKASKSNLRAKSAAVALARGKRDIPTGPAASLPVGAPLISAFIDDRGDVSIGQVADSFGMSKSQLAETVGLGREALYKVARANAAKTQGRVREMLEIVSRIAGWAGGKDQAMAWYRAQPIPAFGDRTAESLVKTGQAAAVRDYLDHIEMGGFA